MPTPTILIDPFIFSIILTLVGLSLGLLYIITSLKIFREKKYTHPVRQGNYGEEVHKEDTGNKAMLRATVFLIAGIAMFIAIGLMFTGNLAPIWVAGILFFGAAVPVIW